MNELLKIPTMADILNSDLITLDETNKLNVLLNQPPPKKWIKLHPYILNYKYLPIDKIEYLLTKIFYRWRVEVKDLKLIGNSVVVSIRLHFFNPVLDEWDWQDGVGASPLQTDKEAGAIEFDKLKAGAVMMSAPAAESYAIKDAAEKIGKIFGKDLNRKDVMDYNALMANKINKNADLFEHS